MSSHPVMDSRSPATRRVFTSALPAATSEHLLADNRARNYGLLFAGQSRLRTEVLRPVVFNPQQHEWRVDKVDTVPSQRPDMKSPVSVCIKARVPRHRRSI